MIGTTFWINFGVRYTIRQQTRQLSIIRLAVLNNAVPYFWTYVVLVIKDCLDNDSLKREVRSGNDSSLGGKNGKARFP